MFFSAEALKFMIYKYKCTWFAEYDTIFTYKNYVISDQNMIDILISSYIYSCSVSFKNMVTWKKYINYIENKIYNCFNWSFKPKLYLKYI